ncbi:MAG: PKD domain-containing protein, partial [Saprospiraceae bacterium]|nr:PKD domain-containing protein [Saprospiraceae bacterium]
MCKIESDSVKILDSLSIGNNRAVWDIQFNKEKLYFIDRIPNGSPSGGLPSLDSIFHQEDAYFCILDSLNGTPRRYNATGVTVLPNLPNYELGPDLHPGFTTNLPDSVLCVGQTFTVTDTSWGHFRRKWEWGDGTFSDTLPVKQHWELLGLLDTFRVMSHTFAQPGTYNLTLHIINDSSEF